MDVGLTQVLEERYVAASCKVISACTDLSSSFGKGIDIMDIKNYLGQVRTLNWQIDSAIEQLNQLKNSEFTSRSFVSGCSGTHDFQSSVEKTVEKIVLAEEKINAQIDQLMDKKEEIKQFLSLLEDKEIIAIMEMHYICGKSWEYIAEQFFVSTRTVYNMHKRAIDKLSQLYSTGDSAA